MAVGADPIRRAREACEEAFAFLPERYGCRFRGRLLGGSGFELYYWNDTTGVRVVQQMRDPFYVYLCRLPDGPFPPGRDEFGGYRRIDWIEVLELVEDATGELPRFPPEIEYGMAARPIVAKYVEWLQDYGDRTLRGDFTDLHRLRPAG